MQPVTIITPLFRYDTPSNEPVNRVPVSLGYIPMGRDSAFTWYAGTASCIAFTVVDNPFHKTAEYPS